MSKLSTFLKPVCVCARWFSTAAREVGWLCSHAAAHCPHQSSYSRQNSEAVLVSNLTFSPLSPTVSWWAAGRPKKKPTPKQVKVKHQMQQGTQEKSHSRNKSIQFLILCLWHHDYPPERKKRKQVNLWGQKLQKYLSGVHALKSSNICLTKTKRTLMWSCAGWNMKKECLCVLRRTGWMILFGKTDFIKEKRTTCAREHSLCLCGTDPGFGLHIFAYNPHVFCIETLAFEAYTATYIYIYLKYMRQWI